MARAGVASIQRYNQAMKAGPRNPRPVPMSKVAESVNGRGSPVLLFICHSCSTELAALTDWKDGHDWAVLNILLARLPRDRDGMPAFGLPQRVLTGHSRRAPAGPMVERPRWQRERHREMLAERPNQDVRWHHLPQSEQPWVNMLNRVRLPIIAYCPRAGVCGRANRLDMRPIREWMRNHTAAS